MKPLFLLFTCAVLVSCSSTKSVSGFYHANKKDAVNFTVPGWLIWFGTGIANEYVKDPEIKAGLAIAKKVKRVRLLVKEKENQVPASDVATLVNNLRNDHFEDLIYVKDGTTTFSMMIREKKDKIRNLFILVHEPDQLMMIEMKTRLRYKDIRNLIHSFKKEIKPLKKQLPQA